MEDPDDLRSSRMSLKALARALAATGCATLGGLWITGNPLAVVLMPWLLGAAAILLGLSVWRIDARPRAQWRGMAASAVGVGVVVLVRSLMG